MITNFLTVRAFLEWTCLLFTLLLISCATGPRTPSVEQLSYRLFAFPDGTSLLGVTRSLNRDEILDGCYAGYGVQLPSLRKEMTRLGHREEDIKDGSATLVLNSLYWNNASAPLRAGGGLRWAVVPDTFIEEVSTEGHSVVEVKIKDGVGEVVKVRHENLHDSDCKFDKDKKSIGRSLVDTLTFFGVGPSGSTSLDCPELKDEGWTKYSYGWENEYVWVKFPEGYVPPDQ